MKKFEDTGIVLARILMAILFVVAGWGKLTDYAGTQQFMASMGIPALFVPLTVLLEFGGGLAIMFGFLTRTTALITAIFTVLTAILAHSNFAVDGPTMFLKNISIAGGFLLLAINGPGALSIDRLLGKKW
ncbi:MAG TPA: DoxX family protein [Erwinia persicina]|uniref:DoxX family protein n=1 Tax=Erwinia persicina TaxID=55211 RepID=A0A3S7S788_9GAMM|nr:DoxX family protein [Erwinia persicina]AXU96564.1 DoxX family protein [Erwinia persicina]MBC3944654.1 DoxX family protein [Erwinia persicina]MBD8106151.1 DoxX family protein [Erwinia persicina]MBD8208706.1 DoxX family protein [Erwinia persicina]MCQ4094281.1 DoxX family protein [Erwinia persicina]